MIAVDDDPASRSAGPPRKAETQSPSPVPLLLLLGFLAAAAAVPDEAILRWKVTWTEGLLILAGSAMLVVQIASGRIRLPWPGLLLGSLLPGGIALVLTATRTDLVSAALARDEVERLLLFPLAFWCAATVLASERERGVFVGAVSVSVIVVAALAVAQNLAGELGLPIDRSARPPATFGNPVFLAAVLVLTMPLCTAEALYASGWRRWAGAVALGLALPALRATQSRWAWLGFGVALCVGITALAPPGRPRRLLLIGLAGAALLMLLVNRSVVERPQQHALIWRDTLWMALDKPWGIGPGQFPVAFLDYASRELLDAYPPSAFVINDAHNEPLQVLAELGWPGLLAIALLVVALLLRAIRGLSEPTAAGDRPLRVACLAALCGALVQSLGSPDLRFVVSTMMFGTVAGLCASFAEPAQVTVPDSRLARILPVGLVLLGAAFVLHGVYERLELAEMLRPSDPSTAQSASRTPTPVPGQQPSQASAAPGSASAPIADSPAELVEVRRKDVEARPYDPARHYALGLALALERRYAEAAESFRTSLVLAPGNASAIRSLGVSEGLSGQFASAVSHLRLALEVEPENVEMRYLYAYSSWRRGDLDTAIAALELVLEAKPDHRQARLLLEKLRE